MISNANNGKMRPFRKVVISSAVVCTLLVCALISLQIFGELYWPWMSWPRACAVMHIGMPPDANACSLRWRFVGMANWQQEPTYLVRPGAWAARIGPLVPPKYWGHPITQDVTDGSRRAVFRIEVIIGGSRDEDVVECDMRQGRHYYIDVGGGFCEIRDVLGIPIGLP